VTTAVEKLRQSRLSPQTELLKDDLSIGQLYLWQDGRKTNADIAPLLIGQPTAERTIDGASSVRLPVTDIGRDLLNSGLLSKRCDIEIDGLWFRLVQLNVPDFASVELVFEDREIAVLREYPKPGSPHNGFKVWDPTRISRLQVAHWLVTQPGREHELDIGFVAPGYGLGKPSGSHTATGSGDKKSKINRSPGFGPHPGVTVKGVTATKKQLEVIDTILQVGVELKARRKVLVAAIMVATAESGCGSDVGNDPSAVGVFQQNPDYWAATGNVAKDAGQPTNKQGKRGGFFEAAIANDHFAPALPLPRLCTEIQRNAGGAATYAPWQPEAEHTVSVWAGDTGAKLRSTPTPETNNVIFPTGGHPFTRGRKQSVNGKVVYVREDNWACLQRLAKEVDWRCFCVSGSVYFATDDDLIHSAPIHKLSEDLDWVDQITGQLAENLKPRRSAFVVKKSYAQMTVNCRIHRWQAPPGSCVELEKLGPFDGRWIVTDVQRPLLNNNGVVTLKKPQPALPEALSPELRQSGGGKVFVPSGGKGDTGYVDAGAIVAAANKALVNRDDYRYLQKRPMPSSLFGKPVPKYIDCSSFVTLVYKAAKMPDPNGLGYNGSGNTDTLWENGNPTKSPQPGDLVFWTSDPSRIPVAGSASHVAVFIGDGEYIACQDSSPCIVKQKVSVPLGIPLVGYRTFRQPSSTPPKGGPGANP
jgi:cell wall-associated NlpC family hydrolase